MKVFSVEWNSYHTEVGDTKGIHSPRSSASNVRPTKLQLLMFFPQSFSCGFSEYEDYNSQDAPVFRQPGKWISPMGVSWGRLGQEEIQPMGELYRIETFFDCTKGIGIFGAFVLVEGR